MAEKNKFWLAAAILWLSITPPCVSYAWNEPDSFMGLKFWRPIGEGSMPDRESIRPPLVMRPKPSVNPAERSRPSASKAENELTKSRNSTLDNLQSRDDILNRLLVQHEAERTERLNEYENRRNLYYQGKISRAEVTEAEEALAGAILRVDEDKRLLADADSTVANIIGAREPCWEKLGNDGASHRVKNVAIGGFFFDINAESLEGKLARIFSSCFSKLITERSF